MPAQQHQSAAGTIQLRWHLSVIYRFSRCSLTAQIFRMGGIVISRNEWSLNSIEGNEDGYPIDVRPLLAPVCFKREFPGRVRKHRIFFRSWLFRKAPIILVLLLILLASTANADWQKVATIGTDYSPMSLTLDGSNAYVPCNGASMLDIIDLDTYTRDQRGHRRRAMGCGCRWL